MSVLVVIPARYDSSRFPGKLLQKVADKALLQWVIEGVQEGVEECSSLSRVVVATDHKALAQLAENCGVQAVMTPSHLPSGTDRVWVALQILEKEEKVSPETNIINVQGDEPLVSGDLLKRMYAAFEEYPRADMVTLARPLESEEELFSPHCVKVVRKANGEALYFSRFPLPHSRSYAVPTPTPTRLGAPSVPSFPEATPFSSDSSKGGEQMSSVATTATPIPPIPITPLTPTTPTTSMATMGEERGKALLHIGVYGYRWRCLQELCEQKPTLLEQGEGLEQLRALYLNKNIQVLKCAYKNVGVDEVKDIAKVEKLLIEREKARKENRKRAMEEHE